ncbi:xylulokinase [Butyrivibrio fibrisolvens DSM 3071]|uniref:Xylulokinase n=1 Tax=Butyrivibrio fibrisolvens DSM 3071 TaxID=1121131 RepID=A0A1M6CLZ7_BUTFI|nr:FGGY-family carbohydrate kinase [Butyrivibrio fibrisolvens]SHI61943.1 xylulokinase [Butyrivibrio fibrisolvens DSM 3071]
MGYVIAYDVGTTGVKTCLFSLNGKVKFICGVYASYQLYILENGGAEQDADEWWDAMCSTTRELIAKSGVSPSEIQGLSFCSQMQGLVLVDKNGKALRRPMSYMDQRAEDVFEKFGGTGLKISGLGADKLLKSLSITMAAPTSVKDPIWKYIWVREHEPEIYRQVYKWLDVKEYLISRATGRMVMTRDSAYATFLYDTRNGKNCWNRSLCRTYGVRMDHLPEIIDCSDEVGFLTTEAARQLGLSEDTRVFGGGGDATLIGVGAGCINPGETHIYSGTSGWVSTVTDKQKVDIVSMIAAVVGAKDGIYNYFAEMETAGKCFEWVKEHLALDEIGIYLQKQTVADSETSIRMSLYDYLSETVKKAKPGCGGLIFTPWLHGNRCPFEDPDAAGMFFNIKLETGKTEMLRAVLEGICFHLRWMLECSEKKVTTNKVIRFVGGGALSPVTCQMLADILDRKIETVEDAQDVGAVGAAMIAGVGLGLIPSLESARDFVTVKDTYIPNPDNKAVYDKNYHVFVKLHDANAKAFMALND